MNEIFQSQLSNIRDYYQIEKNPTKREHYIIKIFESLFSEKGYYTFKFKINFPDRNQTSHYLYLVTKVKIAYQKIKDIMKEYSNYQPDGVPLFSANSIVDPIFFGELATFSIMKLEADLRKNLKRYSGKTIEDIYSLHSIDTNYIKANYKTVFEKLYSSGEIKLLNPKGNETDKITYTSTVKI